jgi:hypothetical protein
VAVIQDHLAFIRFVRELAWQARQHSVVDAIDADTRDRMGEPDYYGMSALYSAEAYFDNLDCADLLMPGCKPEGAIFMIYQKPNDSRPVYAPGIYIDGKLHYLLNGGIPMIYKEEYDWKFIAFQEPQAVTQE